MPTNYNPYLQNFQSAYPTYSSFAPAQAMVAPVQPARPVMGGNVLGYQVDGEVGAKAFPFQNGSNEPLVLWDMNDSVFYLRSYSQAGFPNPLKRYRFVEEEMPQALPAGMSGNSMANAEMASRNDMDELRKEVQRLTALVNQLQGQNSNQMNPMNQNQSTNSGPAFIQNGSHSNGNNSNMTQQNRR